MCTPELILANNSKVFHVNAYIINLTTVFIGSLAYVHALMVKCMCYLLVWCTNMNCMHSTTRFTKCGLDLHLYIIAIKTFFEARLGFIKQWVYNGVRIMHSDVLTAYSLII